MRHTVVSSDTQQYTAWVIMGLISCALVLVPQARTRENRVRYSAGSIVLNEAGDKGGGAGASSGRGLAYFTRPMAL